MRILGKMFATLGFLTFLSLAGSALFWYMNSGPVKLPEQMVLVFDFGVPVAENTAPNPLMAALGDGGDIPFRTLPLSIDRAARDARVKGLIMDASDVALSSAQVEEVRAALTRFKAAGKFVKAYADSFGEIGPANRHYWLASVADEIMLQPLGVVGIIGPSMDMPFAKAALDKVGITPDILTRHEYKGAMATYTAATIPEPLRENYQRLIDDVTTSMATDIAGSRGLTVTDVRRLMDEAPLTAEVALKEKLVDRLVYRGDAMEAAKSKAPGAEVVNLIDYAYGAGSDKPTSARVALVYIDGAIVTRDDGGSPFASGYATSQELVPALEGIGKDDGIKAVLIRVNSPGGSVAASESILAAIKQLQAKGKYVVVSMGDTAASGGYWVSSSANLVFAQASTITGSIGVLAGKTTLGGLAEKVGVSWAEIGGAANSSMWSPNAPFTDGARARINASLDTIYDAFIARVAEGRKLTPEQLDKLARGRVWTGASAKAAGLVDEIGGFKEAANAIRAHLGLKEDDLLSLELHPAPEAGYFRILKLLRGYVMGPSGFNASLESLPRALGLSPVGTVQYMGPRLN